ncbi:hypothetical protein OG379_25055 [Streptomyces sp. NBC_01166]|nr:hypothetical protein OG379_25055 [Streptomyces sp. NBC_01166]
MSEYRTVFHPEARAELRKVPRDTDLRILTNGELIMWVIRVGHRATIYDT